MLDIRIGGSWLRTVGPFTDLTHTHAWPHGSDQATWRMPITLRHPLLDRGGALVEGFTGGIRTWLGRLAEPAANGQYAATGAWSQLTGVYALDSAGDPTNIPDVAIDQAIIRGALTIDGFPLSKPASLSAVAWGTAGEAMKLTDLLDQAMAGLGKRWWVDPDGAIRAAADPTTPRYVVPQVAAGRGLTLAQDDYYSHLIGSFLKAGPAYDTVTVGDAAAAGRFGYREAPVDLTDMGVITAGTATTELNGRLALTGARMGFAETLQLGYGQLTTPGGTPVQLCDAVAATRTGGQMVRLMGVTDQSRPAGNAPYTDIVISRSTYSDRAPTATLAPVGMAARNLEEDLVRGAAA